MNRKDAKKEDRLILFRSFLSLRTFRLCDSSPVFTLMTIR